MNKMGDVDVIIVGGGLAGSATLGELVERADRPLKIAILDKNGAFGGGMPYAKTMPLPFLLLDQAQYIGRPDFVPWLHHNAPRLAERLRTEIPSHIQSWAHGLATALENGAAASRHIPRQFFGDYLRDNFSKTVRLAAEWHHHLQVVHAAVQKITPLPNDRWCVMADGTQLHTDQLVLATGALPRHKLFDHDSHVHTPYAEPLPQLQKRLQAVLEATPAGQRRVIIKGSHATAIEMVYALYLSPKLFDLCEKIVVISPGGHFPAADISTTRPSYPPERLLALKDRSYDVHALWQAYCDDHAAAKQKRYTIRDAESTIGTVFHELLTRLPDEERRVFVEQYGRYQKRLVRRMAPHYVNIAHELERANTLCHIATTIDHVSPNKGLWRVQCGDGQVIEGAIYADCSGFSALSQTAAPLWHSLLSPAVGLRPNTMDRGIIITSNLMAKPNLYALGPMLGGTTTAPHYFWELMSIRRITKMAEQLADTLTKFG